MTHTIYAKRQEAKRVTRNAEIDRFVPSRSGPGWFSWRKRRGFVWTANPAPVMLGGRI